MTQPSYADTHIPLQALLGPRPQYTYANSLSYYPENTNVCVL